MYLFSAATLLLSALLTGEVGCVPVTGIDPVTPGRLIPVSEATEDLPTPGYRMMDLRQRVLGQHLLPLDGFSSTSQSPTEEPAGPSPQTTPSTTSERDQYNKTESSTTSNNNETTQTSLVPSQSDNSQPSTESPTAPNKEVPVEESLVRKIILPQLCSLSGLGCRDSPTKPADTKSQGTSQEPSGGNSAQTYEMEKLGKQSDNEFPGHFFLNNSQRISPTDNSTSLTADTVNLETIAHNVKNDLKEDNHQMKEDSENHISDQSTEGSYTAVNQTTNDILSGIQGETKSASTEEAEAVQETNNQQELQAIVQEEMLVRNISLGTQTVTAGEANQQKELQHHPQFVPQEESEPNTNSKNEYSQISSKAIRRLDEITKAPEDKNKENEEMTTVRIVINGTNEDSELESKKTKASEEEQKLMEVSSFDDNKAGEESLSIGQRISSYWHAATDYVSKVLHI